MKAVGVFAFGLALAGVAAAAWSEPAVVAIDAETCVTYRARVDGEYLVVEAAPGKNWHVYAMDNEERAKEALKGKPSLGVDGPTKIAVSGGLEIAGPWLQSEPHDYSKPEMRWYTWGYEQPALFVAKVKQAGAGPATVAIRGQACDEGRCKNVDIELTVAVTKVGGPGSVDFGKLIPVRE